jgi:hypothetical protein
MEMRKRYHKVALITALLAAVAITYGQSYQRTIFRNTTATYTSAGFNGFSHYRLRTIDHTLVGADGSYVVPISGTYAGLKTVANGGSVTDAQGDDIVVTSDTCVTKIPYEIERWDGATGEFTGWALVSLNTATDVTISVCYGNAAVTTFQGAVAGAVWDSNQKAVYHLTDVNDATSNAQHLDNHITNTTFNAGFGANGGKIGHGITIFSPDYLERTSFTMGAAALTLECWVYINVANGFFVEQEPVNGTWELFSGGSNDIVLRGASSGDNVSATSPGTGSWHHYIATISGTTGTIYIDGVQQATGTVTAFSANTNALNIGRYNPGGLLNGLMDEIRISNSSRATYAITNYKLQANAMGLGAEN